MFIALSVTKTHGVLNNRLSGSRPREVDGQWKHDLFYDDREEHQQDRGIL